ncbi:MAG: VWA domain-containing protein [Polyangiaceae bacterium]|nr:VWA domain-containing protein [Polyangiaceae bacterium]
MRLSLCYRYFTLKLGELRCVRTPGEVVAALADVVGTPRKGGTDIQAALLSSFALIRDAKREDPDLARASIVLITDGEAPVDGELVRRAREEASDVAISVSVIALGEENPVLRQLVARQRARGERAFYHHMDDRRLADLCRGEATRFTVHGRFEEVGTDAWKHAIDDVLVELDDLEASRRNRLRGNEYAEATASADGARALEEAAARDHHALERRYARWFPRLDARTVPVAAMELTTEEAGDRDAVRIVLSTVAEVVGELGGDALHRRSDAIELAERLLLDSRLSPARYRGFLESFGNHLADELEAVHAAVAGPDASFAHRLESAAKTT